jgi:hypothetical protein
MSSVYDFKLSSVKVYWLINNPYKSYAVLRGLSYGPVHQRLHSEVIHTQAIGRLVRAIPQAQNNFSQCLLLFSTII